MRKVIAPAIAMIALTITATGAHAATTRAEYVAQVDPFCQSAQVRAKGIEKKYFRRIKRLIRHGMDPAHPTKPALHAIRGYADRTASILRDTISSIAAVAPAPGDEATVSQWLGLESRATDFFQSAYHALARSGKPQPFRRLIGQSGKLSTEASALVQDWGFQYCQ